MHGVGGEGDVLPRAREENPGEGFQEKSSQVPSRQGEFDTFISNQILNLVSGR